jgi:hypothetical protein
MRRGSARSSRKRRADNRSQFECLAPAGGPVGARRFLCKEQPPRLQLGIPPSSIGDAVALAGAPDAALQSDSPDALDAYTRIRRPVAKQVIMVTNLLTRLALMDRQLRTVRNVTLRGFGRSSATVSRSSCRGLSTADSGTTLANLHGRPSGSASRRIGVRRQSGG